MQRKTNNSEYKHFDKLSAEWWDENGKFKTLHQIRPIRINYILNQTSSNNLKKLDILDLGCGGGLVSESLSRLGANVTGIDFIENNIKVAKQHAFKKKLKVNYLHGDIEKIKIYKKYDFVIMFEILEHLDNWKPILLSYKNNLKKNGKIIISTINRNIVSKFTAIYFAENVLKWIPKGTHTYEKLIKPEEINKFMIKNNFRFNNIKGLSFNPLKFYWELSDDTSINYFCTYTKIN